jgi:[ribosomal protein S18]-alanine N-acetyltransferase
LDALTNHTFSELIGEALELKAITPDLIEQILPIERLAYPHPWTEKNFSDCLIAGYDAVLLKGRLSGKIYAYSVSMAVVDEVHLLNITVAPDHQRKGLGLAHLLALLEKAKDRGASGMLLEVRVSNAAALSLYTCVGFVQLGRRVGYYPSNDNTREDALVMFHHLRNK